MLQLVCHCTGPRLAYVLVLLSEDQYTICLTFYSVHCLEIGFIILLCFSFSYFHHYFIRRMRVLVYWLLIFCCIPTSRCNRILINSGFVSTPAMLNQTNRSKPRRRPKLCLRIEVETQKKLCGIWPRGRARTIEIWTEAETTRGLTLVCVAVQARRTATTATCEWCLVSSSRWRP